MIRGLTAAACLAGAMLSACSFTQEHFIDFDDVTLSAPTPTQLAAWRAEAWREDPRQVAHYELQLRLDVSWKGERFLAARYTFHESDPEHPEWGSYVVRGYTDASGRTTRYRVKLKRDGTIWYATEISHYMVAVLPHPVLEGGGGPPRTK